ncbi:MAG: 50S ribosomal protein L1 [Rickettsiales bacterium TMED174]|nr:MAG: 50S ribosomal protein L1 [Rickettsiales bacterium TMED174]|tara:strand:+ start:68 stop:748 length:681 start_codon:yes stop_codon:yes gene_type:complete
MSKGKFLIDAYKSFDASKTYGFEDAVQILLKNKRKKVNETIEISMNLGVDPRHADQMVRGNVNLPNGSGKNIKVAVFAKDKNAEDAKKEGADIVGSDDLIEKIEKGFLNFDRVIASPDMMGTVSKVAKILGPKGMMPNPKMGTVTSNIGEAVKLAKSGQVQYKAEKNGIVQAGIAKSDFDAKSIVENVKSFVDSIKKSKPSGAKGTFIKKIAISSTMGVSVNCEIN